MLMAALLMEDEDKKRAASQSIGLHWNRLVEEGSWLLWRDHIIATLLLEKFLLDTLLLGTKRTHQHKDAANHLF